MLSRETNVETIMEECANLFGILQAEVGQLRVVVSGEANLVEDVVVALELALER